MSATSKPAVDKRFFTTEEIEIFSSTGLNKVLRKIPANTLLSYDRLVIRKGNKLAQINETDGSKSFFKYKGVTNTTEQCLVKAKGIDVFKGSIDQLKGIKVKSDKKVYKDKSKRVGPGEIILGESSTALILRDDDDKDGQLLAVTINAVSPDFELEHLNPWEQFYIIDDPEMELWCNYKRVRLENGEEKTLFHKEEGMYKEIKDTWAKVELGITIVLAIIILIGGIGIIAAMTGWFVVVGVIMFPVAVFLAAILTMPISGLFKYIGRYF